MRTWLGAASRAARSTARDATSVFRRTDPRPPDEVSAGGTSRRAVEALVGMPIGRLATYEHALRHRSLYRGTVQDGTESNERLEFLGDAVLGAIVADHLFASFPDRDEGLLTRTRAALVNGKALAGYARTIGLGPLILMSDNTAQADGRHNTTILADAFEAIVGALYLDLGFAAARHFVLGVLDRCVRLDEAAADRSNHKSLLLEFAQARALPQPTYVVVGESGPSHSRTFVVEARLGDEAVGTGTAASKKAAEQEAARMALDAMHAVGTTAEAA